MIESCQSKIPLVLLIFDKMTALGWKPADLARKTNVSPMVISRMFKGGVNVKLDSLSKILDTLELLNESSETSKIPPGSDESFQTLREILSQTSDPQVKDALRTNLVAFKNSIFKDKKNERHEKRIDKLEREVFYLKELYNSKIKSDT